MKNFVTILQFQMQNYVNIDNIIATRPDMKILRALNNSNVCTTGQKKPLLTSIAEEKE